MLSMATVASVTSVTSVCALWHGLYITTAKYPQHCRDQRLLSGGTPGVDTYLSQATGHWSLSTMIQDTWYPSKQNY